MLNKLFYNDTAGNTVYALVRDHDSGKIWNEDDGAWETYSAGNIGDYDIPLTEHGASGTFVLDVAAKSILDEFVDIEVRTQAGGSPAESDTVIASGTFIIANGQAAPYQSVNMR